MLGMFNPSPAVTVVIPVREGSTEEYGPKVNDNYFGSVPADRLKVAGNIVYFRADGKSRGKIGIPPLRALGTLGSFDFENNIRLEYTSDEDGIIKSIRAGNVALSLPSTRFVTFSAQNSGLFGIKSELQIGRLGLTAIVVALSFLVFLFGSIIGSGYSAFRQTYVELSVTFDESAFTSENLAAADFPGLVKQSLRAMFPEVEGRAALKNLNGAFRRGGGWNGQVEQQVVADHQDDGQAA